MSARDLARQAGLRVEGERVGMLAAEGLRVPVVVLDARRVFGRVDYLVSPVGGEGSAWVSEDRIHLLD